MKKTIHLLLFLGLFLILLAGFSGCSKMDVKAKPHLLEYMNKTVVLVSAPPPKSVKHIWPQIMQELESQLSTFSSIGTLKASKEFQQMQAGSKEMSLVAKQYLTTLSLTNISNKELAWKLEEHFQTPYFIVLDYVSFPCTKECSSEEQWVVRLKMLDIHNGELIYRARLHYQLEEDERQPEERNQLLSTMVSEISEEFTTGFIVPWHVWRFEHIKSSKNRKLRKDYGI